MTLIDAYYQACAEEDRVEHVSAGRAPALTNAMMLGALGCLWAGAFAVRFGWF